MLLWLTACQEHAPSGNQSDSALSKQERPLPVTDSMTTPQAQQGQPPTGQGSGTGVLEDWDKKIVKTAQLNMEVKALDSFTQRAKTLLKGYGAYIAAEKQENTPHRLANTLSVKVPVHLFDEAVNALCQLPVKVIGRQVSTEDVSAEMVDTRARIAAKQQMRLKYLEFLKQAKNMEEVLQVQQEIDQLQELIEAASGRVNYLGHASAFSTIHLSYYQPLHPGAILDQQPGFGAELAQSLGNGWSIIKGMLLLLATVWPLLLLALAAIVLYKKRKGGRVAVSGTK
jgi:hypothetical protein